jgi:hypothetical protein
VGPMPAPYGYAPALADAVAVAARADRRLRRRSWALRILLATLALLLVAAAAVGVVNLERAQQSAQAGAAPTPAIPVPDGFVEFSDSSGIFACAVPSSWQQVSSTSGNIAVAVFGDASQQTTLSIQYTVHSTLDEAAANDQALAQLTGNYSGGKLSGVSHAASGSFAGETWAEEDATLTAAGTNGAVTLHVAAFSAIHQATRNNVSSRYLVTIIEVAPTKTFAAIDANDFQVVQASFVFLG